MKLDTFATSDTERGESVVVFQPPKLPLHHDASPVETLEPFGVPRYAREQPTADPDGQVWLIRLRAAKWDDGFAAALLNLGVDALVVVRAVAGDHSPSSDRSRQARTGYSPALRTWTLDLRWCRFQTEGNEVALRETYRWRDLYRGRAAVEREFGTLKHLYGLAPLRVRGLEHVALHADLVMLARLSQALARARAVPLAA
jgi:hypothetical protein